MALYDEEAARGRVSTRRASDSEGVCDDGAGSVGNDDAGGGKSVVTEDDTGCVERGGGEGVNSIIQ